MLYISILIFLIAALVVFLGRELSARLTERQKVFDESNREYQRLSLEKEALKNQNASLEKSAEETIALYDVTKDICRSLDEEKIFGLFRDRISGYIKAEGVTFVKNEEGLAKLSGYQVLPLIVNKNPVGYLAARTIAEQDKEKFNILAQQFLLGLQRSLLYKRVQELTITDTLTQTYSRRYFLEKTEEEILRSRRFKLNFSFLMVDIDRFKAINDNYGHLVGDVILKEVTKTIKESIRQIDFMGRYGGEELAIVLTETDKSQSSFIAERIRQAVEARQIAAYDESLKVTISIGVALFPDDAQESLALIDKADNALYQAKQSGRNKVVAYG